MTNRHRAVLLDSTDEHGGPYRVRFGYDPALIEHIKAAFPKADRRYDPATKTWFVASCWLDALIEEFCESGYDIMLDGEPLHCPAA